MTAVLDSLRAFAVADLTDWHGVPGDLGVGYAGAVLPLDEAPAGEGFLGEDRRPASWLAPESATYEGGLRVWHDEGRVLVLEGLDPVDAAGKPLVAPDLGAPEAVLEIVLGRRYVIGGERVYCSRGLSLRVDPDNEHLVGVVGFAPESVEFYRARRRPDPEPHRLLQVPDREGGAA